MSNIQVDKPFPKLYLTPNYDHTEYTYCNLAEVARRFNNIPVEHEKRRLLKLNEEKNTDKFIKITFFASGILLLILLSLLLLLVLKL